MKNETEAGGWVRVMDEAGILEGGLAAVYPSGVNVALARFMGRPYAFEGKCLHMGCPLSCGVLEGAIVTCPCHDWRFDIRNGQFIDSAELRLRTYPILAEGGGLFIRMEPKGEADE